MAIKMVREPSETPNINNIDDIIPMRYAYGGQNGFVIGKGTEISNTVSGLNFTVNSGRLVLQGVECDIDASGVTITIDNIATTRYYTIYLEVNLGLNTATIKDEYDTATYPTIDAGDDLTENTTGVARLPLYQFTATSGIISEVNKVVESVKYVNQDFIKNVKVNNSLNADNVILDTLTQTKKPLIYNNNSLIYDEKDIWISESLWTGSLSIFSNPQTIQLNTEKIYSLKIGDIIEILFKGFSNGDMNFNGSKLVFMPILYDTKTKINKTISVIDITISDSNISASIIDIELNNNIITITPKDYFKSFQTSTGGGANSLRYIESISVIRRKTVLGG